MTHSKLLQHIPARSLLSAAGMLLALAGEARAQTEIDTIPSAAIRAALAKGSDAALINAVLSSVDESFGSADLSDGAALDDAIASIAGDSRNSRRREIRTSVDGVPVGPFPFGNFKLVTEDIPFSFDIPVSTDIASCTTVIVGSPEVHVETEGIGNGIASFRVPGLPGGAATLQTSCVKAGNSPIYVNEPILVVVISPGLTGLGAITADPPDAPFLVWGRRYRFSAPVTGRGIQACMATLQHNDAAYNVPATYDPQTRTVSYVVERNIGGERIIFSCRDNYERTITTRLELPPTSGVENSAPDAQRPTTSSVRVAGNFTGPIPAGEIVTFLWDVSDNVGAISCTLTLDDFSAGTSNGDRRRLQYTVPMENVTSGQGYYSTALTPTLNGLFNHGRQNNSIGAYVWCIDARYNISTTSNVSVFPVTF